MSTRIILKVMSNKDQPSEIAVLGRVPICAQRILSLPHVADSCESETRALESNARMLVSLTCCAQHYSLGLFKPVSELYQPGICSCMCAASLCVRDAVDL